jgi:hypothetical protein
MTLGSLGAFQIGQLDFVPIIFHTRGMLNLTQKRAFSVTELSDLEDNVQLLAQFSNYESLFLSNESAPV